MKRNTRITAMIGVCLLAVYAGSYVYLYANKSPAGNLRYFVYLKGGVETEGREHTLYLLYYPIYKIHKWLGGVEHNIDRPEMVFPKDFKG